MYQRWNGTDENDNRKLMVANNKTAIEKLMIADEMGWVGLLDSNACRIACILIIVWRIFDP